MQFISHTKSGCFSTCFIDSAIFYLFPIFSHVSCYFVYHLLLRFRTGRFFRNRRCDFQQSNVAMLEFCFFFFFASNINSRACLKYTILSLLAHFAVLPLRSRRAQLKTNSNSNVGAPSEDRTHDLEITTNVGVRVCFKLSASQSQR